MLCRAEECCEMLETSVGNCRKDIKGEEESYRRDMENYRKMLNAVDSFGTLRGEEGYCRDTK